MSDKFDLLNKEIDAYLAEAAKDGKVLRKLNIDAIRKEVEMEQGESPRDYNMRLQQLEANPTEPEHYGHFPPELVNWIEGLSDSYFPSAGRKMFTKWLANAIYFEETDGDNRVGLGQQFNDLDKYNNETQYIVDFLNGSETTDEKIWSLSWTQMFSASRDWHEMLANQGKDFRENMGKLGYMTNDVVYRLENGYTIVRVDAEKERDYTTSEAYKCYWARDRDEAEEIQEYWRSKDKDVYVTIRQKITDLDIEGCAMGHCVGGYCDAVRYGEKTIFSLRDKKNEPHATIEVRDSGSSTRAGIVNQIKGFGNETLKEKYRPMVKEWLRQSGLNYKAASDYLNLISPEEVLTMIDTGEATARMVYGLATETDNQDLISKFINMVDDEEAIRRIEGANGSAMLVALSANRRAGPDQVLEILRKNLKRKVLGRRLEDLFHSPFPEFGETRLPGDELAPIVWEEFGDILRTGKHEEYLYYMEAIANYSMDEKLNRQIVNALLDSELVQNQFLSDTRDGVSGKIVVKTGVELSFGKILQTYLSSADNHDRDTLNRILDFIKTDEGRAVAGGPRRIDGYLAKSLSITDSMIEELLSRPELGVTERLNLLENPNVDEKYKYEIMKRLAKRSNPDAPNLYLNGLAKRFVSKADLYSYEFMQWLADSGFLMPHFKDMARGELQKGSSKTIDKNAPSVMKLARTRQALWMHNQKTPDDIFELNNKFKLFYDTLNLQEDIENYFFKIMDE